MRYSKEDEWVRSESKGVTIGISDYAQQQLGAVVFVELPEVGRILEKGEPLGVIESVKTVADLFAPISGEVLEANSGLGEGPEAINDDCYGEGWMLVLSVADASEVEALLDRAGYLQHIKDREDQGT
ncbi:MAG: glycine cleavage system protein GcvH [bacterium]|nr:glycine cleavage system protein GcvH [bacterium]